MHGSVPTPWMDAANLAGESVDRIAGNFGRLEEPGRQVEMIKEIFLVQSGEGAFAHIHSRAVALWRRMCVCVCLSVCVVLTLA